MSRIVGQERIAEVFGVAPKTIVEWQEQGFPVALRGGPGVPSEYESAECIRWRVDSELRKVQGETPTDRLSRVRADAIEMDNAVRRGLLIPADQLEPKLRAALVAAREAWLAEPARLSREVQGCSAQEVEDILNTAFTGFLVKLSQWSTQDEPTEEDED